MQNNFYKIAFLLAALAVALGAFGAHALREMIDEKTLQTYQTAVLYHFLHTFAVLFTASWLGQRPSAWVIRAGWLFVTGIVVFSGSLYCMTFLKAGGITNVNWLGAITPLGGLCFISGWLSLFAAAIKKN